MYGRSECDELVFVRTDAFDVELDDADPCSRLRPRGNHASRRSYSGCGGFTWVHVHFCSFPYAHRTVSFINNTLSPLKRSPRRGDYSNTIYIMSDCVAIAPELSFRQQVRLLVCAWNYNREDRSTRTASTPEKQTDSRLPSLCSMLPAPWMPRDPRLRVTC